MTSRDNEWAGRILAILKVVAIVTALDTFFVSIGLLGAFKDLGKGYGAELIQELAGNPFIGLMLGVLVTSVIQSSSTTTSIVVGLVAAGSFGPDHAKALELAIPIIMGANIGTSITNLLVSLAHVGNKREFERAFSCAVVHDFFNLIAVAIFLPLQYATGFLGKLSLFLAESFEEMGGGTFSSPLKLATKPQIAFVKSMFAQHPMLVDLVVLSVGFLALLMAIRFMTGPAKEHSRRPYLVYAAAVGFAGMATVGKHYSAVIFSHQMATFMFGLTILFVSLFVIVRVMKSVVLTRVESLFHGVLFRTAPRAMLIGVLMTALVQSSSVTTSLVVPLAGAGLLTIVEVFPYTLGANVGTTITAILAALAAGEITGIAVAFAHLSFNVIGIAVIYPFKKIPISMATGLARLSVRSTAYPVAFVLGMYLLLPLTLIFVFG